MSSETNYNRSSSSCGIKERTQRSHPPLAVPAASAVAEAAAHAVAPAVVVVVVVVPAITAVGQKKQDKSKIESLTAEQLSYSHSDARLQNKAEFIDGVMTRKGTLKSLEWPA